MLIIITTLKNHLHRRVRERKELRLRILDAARELFVAGEDQPLTLRQVARKIEYSATAIYLYFSDKQSLIEELCVMDFQAYSRSFQQAERHPDPVERLRRTATVYCDFGREHPHHYRAMFVSPRSGREVTSRMKAKQGAAASAPLPSPISPQPSAYEYLYSAVFKALAAGYLRVELLDAHQVAQTLWAGLHGLVCLSLVQSSHPEVPWRSKKDDMTAAIDCLLRGIVRDELFNHRCLQND